MAVRITVTLEASGPYHSDQAEEQHAKAVMDNAMNRLNVWPSLIISEMQVSVEKVNE